MLFKILCLFTFIITHSSLSLAVLVATLEGHENDIVADGRNVHIIVAGYGGDMGSLTYEMAVTRAKHLKSEFPSDRVVIIGSTPQKEGPTSEFSPSSLEQNYDLTVSYRSDNPAKNQLNDQRPLTGDFLAGTVLHLLVSPEERAQFRKENPDIKYSSSALRSAISTGDVQLGGRIASMDFMTHSSPVNGIFLHDSNFYFHPTSSKDQSVNEFLNQRGMGLDSLGQLQIIDRNKAFEVLGQQQLLLSPDNKILDINGNPSSVRFAMGPEGSRRRFTIDTDGKVYEARTLEGIGESRMLKAESENFQNLNGLFTSDAYVNVSGCSGAYGLVEDMSKVLGVPVNGSATGSLVEVMDQNGDFFYNYPASNPYADGELSDSPNSSRGHALSAAEDRPVMGLRVDQRLYHGYWGVLKSGTNFITSSCHIRTREPYKTEDQTRCEMGMARSMEDSLTTTGLAIKSKDLSFDDFTNILIERMCPNGFSSRGYISESEKEVQELKGLQQSCKSAVRSLSYINKNCSNKNPEYIKKLFQGEVSNGPSDECRQESLKFINEHRFFVPLTDRLGQTLFCSLQKGCEVELKNCEVTIEEETQCLSLNADKESTEYKSCMNKKRCEIDEALTLASNQNNPTFMMFIQNYMNGYSHLKSYRQGSLKFSTSAPEPAKTEENERYRHRMGLDDQSLDPNSMESILEGVY